MWDWADAAQVKLTPVLCQALAELGLENNVLIQLQIRLDRNVQELVWIEFRLEESPHSIPSPGAAPPAGLQAGVRGTGLPPGAATPPETLLPSCKPVIGVTQAAKQNKKKNKAEKPGKSRGSCTKPCATAAATVLPPHTLLVPVPTATRSRVTPRDGMNKSAQLTGVIENYSAPKHPGWKALER